MTYSMIYFGLFFFLYNAGFSNANSFPMRAGYNRFSVKLNNSRDIKKPSVNAMNWISKIYFYRTDRC